MSDELREKVADIFTKAEYGFPFSELCGHSRERMLNSADAAIALVRDDALEEAAKVCLHEIEQPFDEWSSGYKDGCEESAVAIRALKEHT